MLECVFCHEGFTRDQSTFYSREKNRKYMVEKTGDSHAKPTITGRGAVIRNANTHEIIQYINIWCPHCGQEQVVRGELQ